MIPRELPYGPTYAVPLPALRTPDPPQGRAVNNHPAPLRPESAWAEAARIDAVLLGTDPGTDPFVAAVRGMRMPVVISDPRRPDNPVVFANDAFCRLSGYPREEILGRNCRFLQGPDTDLETVRRIRDAVAAAQPIEIDIRNRRKDGELFWNRLLVAPVRDAAGQLAFFFASQMDVTLERERLAGLESRNAALMAELGDRLRAQQASEARMRFATEAGRLGIWERDLRTDALTTSRIVREHFGHDPAAPFSHAELLAAIHPADRARVDAAGARSIETGDDFAVELRVLRPGGRLTAPGGRVAWVELRAQVVRGPEGTPLLMAGTSLDITGRRQADARTRALVDLDDRFRALDDPAELAFAVAEILGQTLEVSRAGYGAIDARAETITIERNWTAPGVQPLAGTLRFRNFGSHIEDLKRGDTVVIADVDRDPRIVAADFLKTVSVHSFIDQPVTEGGGLVALFYLHHDTPRDWQPEELDFVREVASRTRMAVERRRAEAELKALAATLESLVAERTAELMQSEAALRQAQKMEAVGQLTGGIAHDFNNLLTGIMGSLELLKTRVEQGRLGGLDRFIAAAQGAAARAAALTHRLLAFSRRQTLEPRATDVNRLVSGMEELVRRTVGPAIAVTVSGPADLWATLVDPSQLENALLNLCINARDAMPDGGQLRIETANRCLDERAARAYGVPPGSYVSLAVADTGAGMTPAVAAKAFDPFFTTKPIGQGTGLGLSMIYGFVRQSGGAVRIHSAPSQGTAVRLFLPRHAGRVENAEPAPDLSQAPRARQGETVLVVDDEATVRMLATEVLQELGYRTLEAEDGAAGLRAVRSEARIDLLVTDVGLPGGMNGRQVADAARSLRPGLRVLFITGYAETAVLSHGHLEPGMHVLVKPFAMEALAARVKDLLSRGAG